MITGRPTKLTAHIADAIITMTQNGVPRRVAARAVGIGPATLQEWLRRGELETPTLDSLPKAALLHQAEARGVATKPNWTKYRIRAAIEGTVDIYAEFAERLRAADALFQANAISRVEALAEANSDWRAWAWLLERRFPDTYGRADRDSTPEEEGTTADAKRSLERGEAIVVKLAEAAGENIRVLPSRTQPERKTR